jgi:cyclopropane fatty-acyl-phospholipid synthase-like methyltransferase
MAALLALAPADRVLEIGTGWGGFAVHAATHYGCDVTTTTISPRQYEFAQRRVKNAGLEDRVTVLADDYRDLEGTFDKIIAIEMIEAVDWRVRHLSLTADACSTTPAHWQCRQLPWRDESFDRIKLHTDFIKTAIFPGGCSAFGPSAHGGRNSNGLSHAHEDDIGLHYGETLRRWRKNLTDTRDDLDALRPRREIRAALGVLLLLLRGRVRRTLRSRRAAAVHGAGGSPPASPSAPARSSKAATTSPPTTAADTTMTTHRGQDNR